MKLKPISAHAGANFRERFRDFDDGEATINLGGHMMADLIEHLENTVAGPDVYAFTSHADLVLNDKDTWENFLVRINAHERSARPPGYEITYYVAPPWLYVIGYTEDMDTAARMVVEALAKAVSS